MLGAVTDLLPDDWTCVENPWLAQYGPAGERHEGPVPFLDAVAQGADALAGMVRDAIVDGHPVVLLGYSGGAVVVHRTLDMLTALERSHVVAVGFVSDPEQPRGVTGSRERHGIRGESPVRDIHARWAADPDDGICLCPDPSPLRLLAQWTPDIGLASPLAWQQKARRALELRRNPSYVVDVRDIPGERARFAEARRLIEGYLGADHVSYTERREPGTGHTYVGNMADWLRWLAGLDWPPMSSPFPPETYATRLDTVARLLSEQALDAAVLTPGPDLRFLLASDIDTHERFSALVVTPTSRRIVVPAVDAAALRDGVAGQLGVEVVPWTDGEDPVGLLELPGVSTIAVSGTMTADHLLDLQARDITTVDATSVLRDVFMVKDALEIGELRRAGQAIDTVHLQVPALLRAGRTEAEVAAELTDLILQEHVSVNFVIVGSGPHGADPHHSYSDRVLADGDIVVVDIGGTLDTGYHSDCTRTYVVGGADRDQQDAYRVLQQAQEAGLAAAKPGITAAELDAVVRDRIADAGYGEYFSHRTGHGIGLSGHEEPFIIAGNDLPLDEGMAFSIEPGIYIPGQWGARIEDIVVLTGDGCEPLNLTSHDLVRVGPGEGDTE